MKKTPGHDYYYYYYSVLQQASTTDEVRRAIVRAFLVATLLLFAAMAMSPLAGTRAAGAQTAGMQAAVPPDTPAFMFTFGTAGTGDGQFSDVQDVAEDNSGNVYVVDSANNRIQKFDASGNFVTKWGVGGTASGEFSNPVALALDLFYKNVYVL